MTTHCMVNPFWILFIRDIFAFLPSLVVLSTLLGQNDPDPTIWVAILKIILNLTLRAGKLMCCKVSRLAVVYCLTVSGKQDCFFQFVFLILVRRITLFCRFLVFFSCFFKIKLQLGLFLFCNSMMLWGVTVKSMAL